MRMRWLMMTLVLLLAASRSGAAQTSACLTNADTASRHLAFVTQQVTIGDSTRLVQQGIPYRPAAGVALVSDSTICQAVINAYNALDSVTATNVGRAYVMTVGTSAYAMVGDASGSGVYFFFDPTYHVLAAVVAM